MLKSPAYQCTHGISIGISIGISVTRGYRTIRFLVYSGNGLPS